MYALVSKHLRKHGFLPICRSFPPAGAKIDLQKRKSTMLPQAIAVPAKVLCLNVDGVFRMLKRKIEEVFPC